MGGLLGDLYIVYRLAESRRSCGNLCWSLSIVRGPNPLPSSDDCYYDTATKRDGKVYTPTVGPNLSPTHYIVLNAFSPPHTMNTFSDTSVQTHCEICPSLVPLSTSGRQPSLEINDKLFVSLLVKMTD